MSTNVSFTIQISDPNYSSSSTYDPFGGSVPSDDPSSGSSGSAYADSSQGIAAIQGLYQSIFDRAADTTGLAASQAYLSSGGSLGALGTAMAYGTEAQNDISVIYKQVLGRPVDAGGLASDQAALAHGTSLAQLRINVADSAEVTSDIGAIFTSVLGRPVEAAGLVADRNALASGQTLAQIRSNVAYSAEAEGDVNAFYVSVLNRGVDQTGLATYQAQLAGGASLTSVRTALAHSAEAVSDLDSIITSVQDRAPNAGDTAWIAAQQQALANGSMSLAQVRSNLATYSGEAGVLATVIQNVQGRAATASDAPWIQAEEQQIANGATIAQITSGLAYYSGEVNVLDNVIQDVQGRTATSSDTPWIQAQQQYLANGGSIAQVTVGLADHSGETGVLDGVIQAVQGRVATSADTPWIQAQQQALANGGSIAQITAGLADYPGEVDVLDNVILNVQERQPNANNASWIQAQQQALPTGSTTIANITSGLAYFPGEAEVLDNVITDVQGRTADAADTPWIQSQEGRIAGGTTLVNVVSGLALYSGETQVVDNFYRGILGVAPSAGQVSTEQNALAAGGTVSSYVSGLSQSSQAQIIIVQAYGDFGQLAPSGSSMHNAEAALNNLVQAFNATNTDSLSELTTLAQGYTTASAAFSLNGLVATLANSPGEATGLVASTLANSYIDGAPAQGDASTLLAAGGESLLDAAFDQAAGLASATTVSLSGVTGCTDTMKFIATYVTPLSNSTIATANQNPTFNIGLDPRFTNGIVWSSQNQGASLYNRIQQQGYPYENYVTSELGSGFEQTRMPFPVFDQWNRSQGIAVSDKTIDTQGSSYLANPSRITVMMDKWAQKMIAFLSGTSGGLTINKAQINSYGFDLAVPTATTAPEWTAICAGRQLMVADFTAAGTACSIIIHSVT